MVTITTRRSDARLVARESFDPASDLDVGQSLLNYVAHRIRSASSLSFVASVELFPAAIALSMEAEFVLEEWDFTPVNIEGNACWTRRRLPARAMTPCEGCPRNNGTCPINPHANGSALACREARRIMRTIVEVAS